MTVTTIPIPQRDDDESEYWSEELGSYVLRYWSNKRGCYVERYRCKTNDCLVERYWCDDYRQFVTVYPARKGLGADDLSNWGRRRLAGRSGSDGRKERKEAREWRLRRKRRPRRPRNPA